MERVAASLSNARLVDGPPTAAERALTDEYLDCSDDEGAEATSSAIDDFERRLASATTPAAPAQQQSKLPPTNSGSRGPAGKPVPTHLLDRIK